MHIRVILLILLVLLIGLSYFVTREYFTNPTLAVNDTVGYIDSTTGITTYYKCTVAPGTGSGTTTPATITLYATNAIALANDSTLGWGAYIKPKLNIDSITATSTSYTLKNGDSDKIKTVPTTYSQPTLSSGDIVVLANDFSDTVKQSDQIYIYTVTGTGTAATYSLKPYSSFLIARTYITDQTLKQPKVINNTNNKIGTNTFTIDSTTVSEISSLYTYKAPEDGINHGDTLIFLKPPKNGQIDTLYQFVKYTKKVNAFPNLLNALTWDSNADRPKLVKDGADYTFGVRIAIVNPQPGSSAHVGDTVMCSTNGPSSATTAIYRYGSSKVLDYYDSYAIAKTWDNVHATYPVFSDCTGFTLGSKITEKNPAYIAPPGFPAGPNSSYSPPFTPWNFLTGQNYSSGSSGSSGSSSGGSSGGSSGSSGGSSGSSSSSSGGSSSGSNGSATVPSNVTVTPDVTLSDTGFTATELQKKVALLRDIKRTVRDELIASRTCEDNHPMGLCDDTDNNDSCDSVQQGNEYRRSKEDMSKYIKKDSIPCWGCTLDY